MLRLSLLTLLLTATGCACDDTDEDGVCDEEDVCPDADDLADDDADGVCDALDACPGGDDGADGDGDGVCDALDTCLEGDDAIDVDGDGVPNACDPGLLALLPPGGDQDAQGFSLDALPWHLFLTFGDPYEEDVETDLPYGVNENATYELGVTGTFDVTAISDPDFAEVAARLADDVDDLLVLGAANDYGSQVQSSLGTETEWGLWAATVPGAGIETLRLRIVSNEVTDEPDEADLYFRWEIWGTPGPAAAR